MRPEKEVLENLLLENPNITLKGIGDILGFSATTAGNYLAYYRLRTRGWSERKHSKESREKISRTRIKKGVAKGERNPNFGEKERPWLEGENHPFRKWHKENPDFGERQRGDANPVHKVKHLYDDPEYVENITKGIREHVREKTGRTYEDVYGEKKALEYKEKLRAASPTRLAKFKRKKTEPERIIREMLEDLGVSFEQEAPLGYHTVDFLLPELKIVIQADGDYWHANPACYEDQGKEPTRRQKDRRRIDASCNGFLRNRGYTLLRFWESELKQNPKQCHDLIREMING